MGIGFKRLLTGVGLGFGLVAGIWLAGLALFAADMPHDVLDTTSRTDTIVVLTGGSERVSEGLGLLEAGLADTLFLSGVGEAVTLEDLNRVVQAVPPHLHDRVVLGHAALDTAGNAKETAQWMARNHYTSLRLVTAAYHMPRSLAEFRHALPGIAIVPHPVFPEAVKQEEWWLWWGTARLVAGEYTKYLAVKLRQVLVPARRERDPAVLSGTTTTPARAGRQSEERS